MQNSAFIISSENAYLRNSATAFYVVLYQLIQNLLPYSFSHITTVCNTRYKTKPGVIYHMTHHHSNVALDDREVTASPKPPVLLPATSGAEASKP